MPRIGWTHARTAGIALVAVLAIAPATTAGTPPTGDSVTGSGTLPKNNTFVFDVHSDADGSNPTGEIEFSSPGRTIEGYIECVRVEGNKAVIIYEIELPPTPTGPPGGHTGDAKYPGGIIHVEDGTVDLQRNGRLLPRRLERYEDLGCPTPTPIVPLRPLPSGDITVTDAP